MSIRLDAATGRLLIEQYGRGGFRVGGTDFDGSVLILPSGPAAWPVTAMAELTEESLAPLAGQEIEILLLGTGPSMAPVPGALRAALRAGGIVVEPMDTGAACRTYNVLLIEGRRVAAALIRV